MDIKKYIEENIEAMEKAPSMFAYTREAFVVHLALLIDLLTIENEEVEMLSHSNKLYSNLFGKPGTNILEGMELALDIEFANKAILLTKKLLKELHYEK